LRRHVPRRRNRHTFFATPHRCDLDFSGPSFVFLPHTPHHATFPATGLPPLPPPAYLPRHTTIPGRSYLLPATLDARCRLDTCPPAILLPATLPTWPHPAPAPPLPAVPLPLCPATLPCTFAPTQYTPVWLLYTHTHAHAHTHTRHMGSHTPRVPPPHTSFPLHTRRVTRYHPCLFCLLSRTLYYMFRTPGHAPLQALTTPVPITAPNLHPHLPPRRVALCCTLFRCALTFALHLPHPT